MVATLPKRVNINTLAMMPVSQSFADSAFRRQANRRHPAAAGYRRNAKNT